MLKHDYTRCHLIDVFFLRLEIRKVEHFRSVSQNCWIFKIKKKRNLIIQIYEVQYRSKM